jgi:Uma2 family endonuclease
VAGSHHDYAAAHPRTALLVVEVADASLLQDRLTKAPLYAAAGIPEYWIVNLRAGVAEVLRDPDRESARYRDLRTCAAGERIPLVAIPGAEIRVADLLPAPPPRV